ncbi:MAG: TRAP transporter small permease [Rhodopirellula sp.]|nr:TRAP transporter small permease [Rhodopirellula sp.]
MQRKPLSPGDWIVAALFAATILVVTAQVVWRYVFNNSLVWTEELSRLLFTWIIFIGAALAVKEGTHIGVSLLVDRLPASVRRHLAAARLVLIAVFLAFLAVVGFQWVRMNANTRTPALGLPLNYVLYASLPAASALGVYFAVRRAVAWFRGRIESEQTGEEEAF